MGTVLIYGRGEKAEKLVQLIDDLGEYYQDKIIAFSDKDAKTDDTYYGYKVVESGSINEINYDYVIIASTTYEKEIRIYLTEQLQVPEEKLKSFNEYYRQLHINYQKDRFQKAEGSEKQYNKKRIAVYTAIQHKYDNLITPKVIDDDVSYICYTDNPSLKSDIWEIRPFEDDDEWAHRKVKLLPHRYLSEFDYSFWVDANYEIVGSIRDYLEKYDNGRGMLFFPHPERHCLYDEATIVILLRKAEKAATAREIGHYADMGMPVNYGLLYGGIIARQHNKPEIVDAMELWWELFRQYSHRDQVSLPYVLWKTGLSVDVCSEFIYGNEWFRKFEHLG